MTEKDKEINELRRENDQLKNRNAVLWYAFNRLITEYNGMLQAVSERSKNIKTLLESLKSDDTDKK